MSVIGQPDPASGRTPAEEVKRRIQRFGPSALATPANLITIGRLVLGLPFLVFIAAAGPSWLAVSGWTVLALSDWADGWFARRDGITRSGAYLDPLADKVITVGGFVALAIEGVYHWAPVALIGLREVLISVHRSLMGRQGISVPARALGKSKTVIQLIAVGWALLPLTEDVSWLIQGFLWLAVGLTVVSGLDVLKRGAEQSQAAGS